MARGDRADVYLAVAEADPDDRDDEDEDRPEPTLPLVVVRVYPAGADDATLAVEIEAMSADASSTLPALHDVASFPDGRCCLIVERIGGPALSRILIERTLTPGEAVTILAPIVVAVAELAARGFVPGRLSTSDILIDEAGRPRLIGTGHLRRLPVAPRGSDRITLLRAGHEALADLIDDVAAAVRPSNALQGVVEFLRGRLDARPFVPCETEVERRLFAVATAEPIGGLVTRARTSRLPARISAPHPIASEPEPVRHVAEAPTPIRRSNGGLRQLLALAQLPSGLSDRAAEVADVDHVAGLRRRVAGVIGRRGRSSAVGALVGGGALVLLLTLVPPATAEEEPGPGSTGAAPDAAATDTAQPEAPSEPVASDAALPADGAGEVAPAVQTPEGPVEAARQLLERRAGCVAMLDLACLEGVLQPGSAIEAQDRASIQAARAGEHADMEPEFELGSIELAAEMGAAVLVRVTRATAEREPASLLMVRGEAGWRLREIFD